MLRSHLNSVPPGFRDVAIATINATSTNPREFSAPCNFEKSPQLFCNFDESSRRGLLQSVVIRQQTHLFCSEDAADVDCQRLTFRLPTKITEKANVANLVFVAIFSDIKKRLETNLAAFWTNLSNQMLPASARFAFSLPSHLSLRPCSVNGCSRGAARQLTDANEQCCFHGLITYLLHGLITYLLLFCFIFKELSLTILFSFLFLCLSLGIGYSLSQCISSPSSRTLSIQNILHIKNS